MKEVSCPVFFLVGKDVQRVFAYRERVFLRRMVILRHFEDYIGSFLRRQDRRKVERTIAWRGGRLQSRCILMVILGGDLHRLIRLHDCLIAFFLSFLVRHLRVLSVRGRTAFLTLCLMDAIIRQIFLRRGVVRAIIR